MIFRIIGVSIDLWILLLQVEETVISLFKRAIMEAYIQIKTGVAQAMLRHSSDYKKIPPMNTLVFRGNYRPVPHQN